MTERITNRALSYAPPTLEMSCFESECSTVLQSNFGSTENYNTWSGENGETTMDW